MTVNEDVVPVIPGCLVDLVRNAEVRVGLGDSVPPTPRFTMQRAVSVGVQILQ